MATDPQSRRLGQRREANFPGRLVDASGCVTEITIKDISPTGARIEAPYGARVPRTFFLRIPREDKEMGAELVWRNGYQAGIRFIASEDVVASVPSGAVSARSSTRVADLRKLARTIRS